MNYQQLYKSLPNATQLAVRELMKALLNCDRKPIIISKTICQSRLETATVHVRICTQEITEHYASK